MRTNTIFIHVPGQDMGVDQVVAEMQRRQASYIRREDKQKQHIETLKHELVKTRADHNDGFLETEKQCDAMLAAHIDLEFHSLFVACIAHWYCDAAGLFRHK